MKTRQSGKVSLESLSRMKQRLLKLEVQISKLLSQMEAKTRKAAELRTRLEDQEKIVREKLLVGQELLAFFTKASEEDEDIFGGD